MTILPADKPKFERLGLSDPLGLALIAPTHYEDRRPAPQPLFEHPILFEATVEGIDFSPKRLLLRLFVPTWERSVEALYFAPKRYLQEQFIPKGRYFFYGTLKLHQGRLQISHPALLSRIGEIVPRYKAAIAERSLRSLIEHYLSLEALQHSGLPEETARTLYALHFPQIGHLPDETERLNALKYAEIFRHLYFLHTKRRHYPAPALSLRDPHTWTQTLPFALTDDQQAAIAAIHADLHGPHAARRVIVGDVGCGKTMVILSAAWMVLPERTILLAPTSILADQLYGEALKYLGTHARIALVTGKSTQRNYEGELDKAQLIVGTHALLHRTLPDAALLIVDEQHRFGSRQRHQLSLSRTDGLRPHFLQFSATPIPRTLAMIESALVDISAIRQIPFPKQVSTQITGRAQFGRLLEHIKVEVSAGRQVAIIYPLIEKSEAAAEGVKNASAYQSLEEGSPFWRERFEGVFITHGKEKEKEQTLRAFAREGSIILATTVIEVGISLPRLSTIVIVGAERLGLATLHQLRGRVARNGLEGYCYLYTNTPDNERLTAFTRTTNGFEIAELDLKLRKSGDMLTGEAQSGREFVWFDPTTDEAILKSVRNQLGFGS